MNSFAQRENKISNILQIASLLAIISTFFGFLIFNIYLALYGFWDFNFLKVQYFTAGVLFIFYVSFPVIFFYIFFNAREILCKYLFNHGSICKRTLIFIFKIVLFIFAFSLSFLIFVIPLGLGKVINSLSFIQFLGFIWITLILFGVQVGLKSHKEINQAHTMKVTFKNIIIYFGAFYRLLYFLIVIPTLVLIFSFFVYPSIPRYLGGGKPSPVSIGLNTNLNSKEIGVTNPFNAIMVYESENSVLVLIDGGMFLIKQSNINYVKYTETATNIHNLQNISNIATTRKE